MANEGVNNWLSLNTNSTLWQPLGSAPRPHSAAAGACKREATAVATESGSPEQANLSFRRAQIAATHETFWGFFRLYR